MNQPVQDLRRKMQEQGVDVYLVPRADEYQGEFVAPCAERLKFLTGFTGSAGLAIIMKDRAALFTDARYIEQAARQCPDFEIFDTADTLPKDFLGEQGGTVGYDPWLHTPLQVQNLLDKNLAIKPVSNLVDQIWPDRPPPPKLNVTKFPDEIAGHTAEEKLELVRESLKDLDAFIVTLPDSVSWLLNIRGDQIPCTPAVQMYLILTRDAQQTFENPKRLEEAIAKLKFGKTGLDFKRAPAAIKSALEKAGAEVIDREDPCIVPKALKTQQEQESIRNAHIRDGVALVKFLHWFEGQREITELGVAAKLEGFRAQEPAYKGPSFPTIAGSGPNGAIIHYRPTPETDRLLDENSLLLIDSGGQYGAGEIWGTTDITRTVAIGTPSREMIESNTRVLKGHIALAMAKFTAMTTGKELDAIARTPLIEAGLNYAHGTGHGVGCYLAVHEEAAQGISPRGEKPLAPGMLLSNEPGYYKSGAYGIRIENLVLVREDFTFETLTLCPLDKTLIDPALLTKEEKNWLNAYHAAVLATLTPLLPEALRSFLAEKCSPLP